MTKSWRLVIEPDLLTPEVQAWLEEAEDRMLPIVTRAMKLWAEDIVVYGVAQKTIEEYVREALRGHRSSMRSLRGDPS